MKRGISVLLLIGLVAIPISCMLALCPAVDHNCCPNTSSTLSACPYDILSTAGTAAIAHSVIVNAFVTPVIDRPTVYQRAISAIACLPSDSGDLSILNRVLLI